jgi:SAM-dependent methyltransferase
MNDVGITPPRIEYLSSPEAVSMGDDWYEFASLDHFWMRRRFEVLEKLAEPDRQAKWAEVGCGNGVVQLQMHQRYGLALDGIDLNETALKKSVAVSGRLLCYNVFDRVETLRQAYDRVILFDVIEHLNDDKAFVQAACHLVRPGGHLIVNVPAFMHFFSPYDVAAGHARRYNIARLEQTTNRCGLKTLAWSYWGAPLVPLLWARKAMYRIRKPANIIEQGFSVRNQTLNQLLLQLSRCERIPQRWYGTSLMASFEMPA